MNPSTNRTHSLICHTGLLTDEQMRATEQLIRRCHETDGTGMHYPFEEEDCHHYLLYEQEHIPSAGDDITDTSDGTSFLCAVLAMLPCGTEVECSAFTRPDRRRQGYFTELLETALETFEEYDVLFPVAGDCPDTLAALDALGAEVESQELMMELELDKWGLDCTDAVGFTVTNGAVTDDGDTWELHTSCSDCTASDCAAFDRAGVGNSASDRTASANSASDCTTPAAPTLLGTCRTTAVSATCVCLHHVEILPQFRRNGCGTLLLTRLLSALKQSGIHRVILQVSGSNDAALALYRKQGFRITETLSYYLY